LNFDNNPIDELFRQAANQSVPELPSGVMDRVLGEWQKMSNPSVNSDGSNNGNAENFQLNSSKISNPSAGEISQVIRIAGKALGFPQLAVAVGFIAVAVAGVVWLSMESNSSDGNQKSTSKMVEERSINVDEENTVEPIEKNLRANGNNDVNEKLETSARPGDLGNSTNVDPGHSVNSINKPAPNNGVSREIGENTGRVALLSRVRRLLSMLNRLPWLLNRRDLQLNSHPSESRICDLNLGPMDGCRFFLLPIAPTIHTSIGVMARWRN